MKIRVKGEEIKLVTEGVRWNGDIDSVCRSLSFSFLYSNQDDKFKKYKVKCGDKVELLDDNNEVLFLGMIYTVDYSTDEQLVNCECYDLLKNVLKSKYAGRYTGDIGTICNSICSTFNIESKVTGGNKVHNIVSTGDLSYFDIMSTCAYNLYGLQNYNYHLKNKTLTLQLKTDKPIAKLEIAKNILSSSYSSSIEDMVNKVLIVETKENEARIHGSVANNDDINTFGLFQEVYSYDQDNKDNVKDARLQLKTVENTSELLAIGDNNVTTGSVIEIYEPKTNLTGKFWVVSDEHEYSTTHKMRLGVKFIG